MKDCTSDFYREFSMSKFASKEDRDKAIAETIKSLRARVAELEAKVPKESHAALEAIQAVIDWDKRRGYIVPYKVRDPLHAILREANDRQLSAAPGAEK